MTKYLGRRILHSIVALFGALTIIFILLRLIPGDPSEVFLDELATEEDRAALRRNLGLDKPIPVQYAIFLRDIARGDLGTSYRWNESALDLVMQRLPFTIQLATTSFSLALIIAIPLGVVSAVRRQSFVDVSAMVAALVGRSMPSFWLGILLILIVAVALKLLPTSGYGDFRYLILPSLTLGTHQAAMITRLTRSSMLEVLNKDYIRTARAKGLSERAVVMRHAFKNAAISIVTVSGMQLGSLLSGAMITETVFAWPGVGWLLIEAIVRRDYPIVQAVLLLTVGVYIIINLVVDISYAWLDPRIRFD